MSDRSYPQAMSYVCKLCGRLTASRSRWHVMNQVCQDGECPVRQQPQPQPESKKDDRPEK